MDPTLTPAAFAAKWRGVTTTEKAAAQEHFIDLCRLLGLPTPAEADPSGEWFTFEYGAKKAGGGDGWADVWRRACFGMEYKGKGKSLQDAFRQLQLYTPALLYPPLLIVSDIETIVIHTAFPNTVPQVHVITLDDILDPAKFDAAKVNELIAASSLDDATKATLKAAHWVVANRDRLFSEGGAK